MRSACLGLALACLFLLLLPLYRVSPQINFTIQVSNRLLYATLINGTTRYYRLDNTSAWSAARVGEEWAVGFTCMSNSSASFFYSRLLGPAILVGSVQNLGDAHYRVAFNITDAGQYRLELILSFLSSAQAYPSGRVSHGGCLCTELHGLLPLLQVLPDPQLQSPPLPSPFCDAKSWPTGRWLEESRGALHWQPLACRLPKSYAMDACLTAQRPLLIGDSHMRVLAETLNHTSVRLHVVKGLYNTSRSMFYWSDVNEAPARSPALRPWLESNAGRETLQSAGVVYFEAGHWDLRDWSVDQFLADVAEALSVWPTPALHQRRVFVTAPAYSYAHHSFGPREYRTLEKLDQANARLIEVFVGAGWEVADFWAVSRPLYTLSCDTHHFLCPKGTHSPVGLAFMDLFVHQLCS